MTSQNKPKNARNLACWIITEGMIGTQNQCVGVAEALGIEAKIIQISLKQPWKTLSPWLGFEQSWSFLPKLEAPYPDLVIAAGRKSVAAARFIKKQSKGHTYIVQLQDPKTAPNQFDLVAVPFHDKCRGDNVLVTNGAPNRISNDKLKSAKEKFSPLFEGFGKPKVAVLIGGNSKTHTITKGIITELANQLKNLEADLMITVSRRTGLENIEALRNTLNSSDTEQNVYFYDGDGENPYLGMLAWADHILVTADSVSMISDAGTTGRPVHLVAMEGSSTRFDKFHSHMKEIGVLRDFNGNLEPWTYEPLSDANKIANTIKQEMGIT